MKIKFFYSICIAQIFFSTTFAQTDLFHEITVNKNFYSKKKHNLYRITTMETYI